MTYSIRSEATRAVITLDGVDRVAFNENGSMELLTPAANPTGNKVPTAGQLPFTKFYESPEQSGIAASAGFTLAHGLGAAPKLVKLFLVCTIAEQGYSVGDIVSFYDAASGSGSDGVSVIYGSSELKIRLGSLGLPLVINATTGGVYRITAANWRLIVRAWA